MKKLKQKDLPNYREELLKGQDGYCVICHTEVKPEDAALDHCHTTGYCRFTIHKDCNILLGKIENFVKRYGKKLQGHRLSTFLSTVDWYMSYPYEEMGRLIHPKHKTTKDKELTKLRRRLKNAKRQDTKDRLKAEIKRVQGYEDIG